MLRHFGSTLVLALALALSGCGHSQKIVEHPTRVQTVLKRTVHADTAFTPWEREAIADAVQKLNYQTNGLIEITIVYDLDWDNGPVSEIARMESYHQMVRIKSDAPRVDRMDGDRKDGLYTQGFCVVDFEMLVNPTKVFLIWDRLIFSKEMYTHVALHELLHSVGMKHVDDEMAVMYYKSKRPPQLCMNMTDAKELCRTYRCDPRELNYCE
jgi:hypothetical protein